MLSNKIKEYLTEYISQEVYVQVAVVKGKNKIILDDAGGQGVVPYLPLNELKKGNSN